MKKLSGTTYTYIVIMLAMVAVVISSLGLSYFASKLLPILFAIIVFILTGVALAKDILAKSRFKVTTDKRTREIKPVDEIKGYLPFAAWIVSFSVGIVLVGFVIASTIFVGAYMKRHGSGWLGTIITAILCGVIIQVVFNSLLQSGLYPGLIHDYLNLGF